MRVLVLVAAVVVGVVSLRAPLDAATHVLAVLPGVFMLWMQDVIWRPVQPCRHCDGRGRDWDSQHKHYGQHCPGRHFGPISLGGSCGATGKRLRPGARLLRAFGAGGLLRNLPAELQPKEDG